MTNGNIPDLGVLRIKPRIGALGPMAFVRHLDQDGMFEATGVARMPDGSTQPILDRASYLSADELLDAVRAIVREEVRAARLSQLPFSGE